MAWRIDERDLCAILGFTPTVNVGPFIDTANALADKVSAKDANSELNAAMLKQIEMYLAAHFYSHADQRFTSRSTDGASGSFQGQFGMALDSTEYGQTAKMLDFTGTLNQLSQGKSKASLSWVGLPPSEQTDYKDRD